MIKRVEKSCHPTRILYLRGFSGEEKITGNVEQNSISKKRQKWGFLFPQKLSTIIREEILGVENYHQPISGRPFFTISENDSYDWVSKKQ